mmetsp:Transcript_3097/g.4774  ORF Transcript_3097/g.4774 Transcript_3097/m.4774 type:complete len:816 (+) Transcript_3097:144-2591(+)
MSSSGDKDACNNDGSSRAHSELPKITHSSSSSLWESITGVASGDMHDENIYDDNSSPGAENCWQAAVVVGKNDCDDDNIIDDNDIDDSSCNNENSERSNSIRSEQQQPLRQKLAQTPRDAFKDPFPLLTPRPRKSLQSSCNRLNAQNEARHNITIQGSTHSLSTTPMKSTHHNEHTTQSRNRSSSDSSSIAPPNTPKRGANNPQRLSVQTTPIRTACNSIQKLWLDPFPTPDASARSRCGTPCSSRDDNDGGKYSKILNPDWDTLLPKIPLIEESSASEEEERPRRTSLMATSSPRLHSMVTELPFRKVFSENNLPLMKRPSMEDIWGALKSGPDGNELVTEYSQDNGGRKKKERRNSEKAMIWKELTLEYQGSELEELLRPRRQNKTFHRSFTAPVVDTSWEHLRSPLIPFPDDDENCGNNVKSNESNNANGHFRNHSATITNVTGAHLAKEVKMLIGQREGRANAAGPMTPNRLSFRAWKSSRTVVNVKTSVGELVFSPVRSVRDTYRTNTQRAAKLVRNTRQKLRNTRQKLKDRKELRRQRRLARLKEPPRSWWIVIPADHPYKIVWDVLTMIWALLGAYRTHERIRDRVFDQSPLIILTEVWFTVDILLNFVTEHKTSKGQVIRDGKAVWARYLTTWFVIDILSLIPWERIYVRPIVERIKKRNFFQKTFFRSKAVVRVSRVLRGRHIKLFGRVSKQTGTPLRKMVKLAIKYLPKYLVFLRNMKGALVVRALRFVHWLHKLYKKIWVKARNARRNLATGHPILSLIEPREDDSDSEDDDDGDDDDDDDEDEEEEEEGGEEEGEGDDDDDDE